MNQNVQFSTILLSQFLVFSLCLFLSINALAQEAYLSATVETGGKSVQIQDEEGTSSALEIPTSIQIPSQAIQKQQKSGSDEITLDGPFCNGCDNPKSGSSLACSGGTNFIIQGIDISSMNAKFLLNSIDFNQESFGGAPNVRVRLFCGTAGTVHHSATHTTLYTETFTTKKSDDGKCVTFELTTPPTVDPVCGTTIWVEFRTTSGDRVVATPKTCNGKTASGTKTYIRSPNCSVNTPKTFKSTGFKLDASYAINVTKLLAIEGDIEYCASQESTVLDATGNWTNYLWSNGATTKTIEVVSGTYTVSVEDADGLADNEEVTVIQHANPVPAITGDLEYCADQQMTTLEVGNWKSHNWSNNKTDANIEVKEGIYAVTVTDSNDCSGTDEVEVVEYSVPSVNMEETGMNTTNNGTGNKVYVVEVCGGTTTYEEDFTSSGGFASVNEQPSENAGCLKYQIVYANGVDWTLTVTDLNICEDKPVVFTSEGIDVYPELEITEMLIGLETCVGDEDGSIEIEVEGGDDSCNDYTYTWTGPNGFNETATGIVTGNTVEDLASGVYNVTVTDCAGTTTILTGVNVTRANIGGRGGRGSGGWKTAGGKMGIEASLEVYPNPFGERTMIEFSVVETSNVWLSVYSMDGRKVASILEGERMEGNAQQRFGLDAQSLQSGLYILELQTDSGLRQYQQLMVK